MKQINASKDMDLHKKDPDVNGITPPKIKKVK
jgi:hypothetical protein